MRPTTYEIQSHAARAPVHARVQAVHGHAHANWAASCYFVRTRFVAGPDERLKHATQAGEGGMVRRSVFAPLLWGTGIPFWELDF